MSEEPKTRNIGKQMRQEAFSIPNLLSYFRLLLIPLFIQLYIRGDFTEALITLAASGLSDIIDGRIARKYNMVTDLGKVLDPVADKLTQCAMMICVATRYPAMWWLLGIHVVKELIMIVMGYYVLKKTDTVNSAIWCGKLCTGVIYAVMMSHVILPNIPQSVSAASAAVCAGLIVLSLVVYTARYVRLLGGKK
ncbi:MAG: CDP-alcohol phosphatidyltransferase family protein [Oscillospiraceae bacterium]|nr:CDP-alcohol phosphatidyltransferase family protein [Oscillospiraceae bacterium]